MKTTLKTAKASTARQAIRIGRTALATINRKGWCRGMAQDNAGRVCATYAISVGARAHRNRSAEVLFRNAVEDVLRDRHQSTGIVRFNDQKARTPRAVKNLFAKALKKLARKAR